MGIEEFQPQRPEIQTYHTPDPINARCPPIPHHPSKPLLPPAAKPLRPVSHLRQSRRLPSRAAQSGSFDGPVRCSVALDEGGQVSHRSLLARGGAFRRCDHRFPQLPITNCYGGFRTVTFKGLGVVYEIEAAVSLWNCQTLPVPRQSRGFSQNKRQDFSHRGAEAKSLLDEVLRRGREERGGAGWKGKRGWGGRGEWGSGIAKGLLGMCAA